MGRAKAKATDRAPHVHSQTTEADMTLPAHLNSYAIDMGFESEIERLRLIMGVPQYKAVELETWMDQDGTKQGLLRIIEAKRPRYPHTEAKPCVGCRVHTKGNEKHAVNCRACGHWHTGECPEIEQEDV
jgi:hypothetical protein